MAFVSSKLPATTDNSKHRERLRQRFKQDGLSGFNNYEVIEYLLTLALARGDCKAIAKTAIKRFKTVRGVLDASLEELQDIDGIGYVLSLIHI